MPVKKTKTYNPQKCGSMINAIAEVNAEIEQIEKEMKKDGYCDVRGWDSDSGRWSLWQGISSLMPISLNPGFTF